MMLEYLRFWCFFLSFQVSLGQLEVENCQVPLMTEHGTLPHTIDHVRKIGSSGRYQPKNEKKIKGPMYLSIDHVIFFFLLFSSLDASALLECLETIQFESLHVLPVQGIQGGKCKLTSIL